MDVYMVDRVGLGVVKSVGVRWMEMGWWDYCGWLWCIRENKRCHKKLEKGSEL